MRAFAAICTLALICVSCSGYVDIELTNDTEGYATGTVDGHSFGLASQESSKKRVEIKGLKSSKDVEIRLTLHESDSKYSDPYGSTTHKIHVEKGHDYQYSFSLLHLVPTLNLMSITPRTPLLAP